MSTTKDSDRVLTIPITKPQATVKLLDDLYASMAASTGSPAWDTHRCAIDVKDGEVHLHFQCVYVVLSLADWSRVAAAVVVQLYGGRQVA